jgi:hypothetical protein
MLEKQQNALASAITGRDLLEVSIPRPPRPETNVRKVRIEDSAGAKSAA